MPGLLCAVAFCKSNSSKTGEKISFFGFPKDNKLRKDWVERCNRKEKFDPTKRKVCHKHFVPDDFEDAVAAKLLNKNPRRLKSNAVPSLFLTREKGGKTKFTLKGSAILEELARKEQQRKLVEELLQDDQRNKCSNLTDLSKLDLEKIGPEIGLDQEACNSFSWLMAAHNFQKDSGYLKAKEPDRSTSTATLEKERFDNVGVRCFVCDKALQESDVGVYSRTDVAQVIRKLLGEDFVMVIKEEDQLCGACQMLVTRISRLEAELRTATLALRALLRLKYSIDFVSLESKGSQNIEPKTMNFKRKKSTKENNFKESKPVGNYLRKNVHKTSKLLTSVNEFLPNQRLVNKETEVQVIPCTIGYIQSLAVEDCDIQDVGNVCGDKEPSERLQEDSHQQCGCETKNLLTDFEDKEKSETDQVISAMNVEDLIESDKRLRENEGSEIGEQLNNDSKKTFENRFGQLYKCGVCNLVATSTNVINAHYLSYKEKEGHYCVICDFGFHHKNQCQRHLASHSEVRENICCMFCEFKAHDRLHLKFHVQKEHQREAFIHSCHECNKSFLHKRSLRKHNLRIHKKQIVLTCEKCKRRFYDAIKYKKHTDYFHRAQMICKFCNRPFSSLEKLYLHEYRHKYFQLPQYYCNFCPRKFIRKQSLDIHEEQHYGEFPFRCQVCELGFHEEDAMKNHQSKHLKSFLKDSRTMCDVCGKTFANRGSYTIHRLLHDNPHPFQCDTCLKKFRYKNKLIQHKRHFHPEV